MSRLIDADTFFEMFPELNCEPYINAPTVEQPTGEWIPVSERLPDKDGKYLLWGIVTEDDEGYYSFVGGFDSGCEKFGDWEELYDSVTLACVDSEFFEYYEVIAWMPLPEPYK